MAKRKGIFRTKFRRNNKMYYAKRDPKGRFVDIQDLNRTVAADLRRKAKTTVKSGQGFRGDIRKKKK